MAKGEGLHNKDMGQTEAHLNCGKSASEGKPSEIVAVFERQVLVFPLLVVVFACTSFLFGGRCSAWQWWTAVAIVVVAPFLKKGGWRESLGAAGLFAGLLVIIKGALPPVFWDNAFGVDTSLYHFPMVQLLIEGWNPVADPLAEGITAKLGLDLWGMAPLHVAFLGKTMAVFSAVSYKFVGDPTSATVPGLTLLWLSCTMQAARTRRGLARWAACGAAVWILPLVSKQIFVDLSLAFAACGLLFTMERDLRRDGCDWLHLAVYTIWMMNIKLNGVLAAFVFWALFAAVKTWNGRQEWSRWIRKFMLFGIGVTLAWGLISWNPLVTSWKAYGHPLYPFKTADTEKWPVHDLTWDIRLVNADFRQMGKTGIWLYEYVSPRMVEAYYRWKTGRSDFKPERLWYHDESFIHGHLRPALWVLFSILLFLPRGRLFGIGGLLLTVVVPWDKIGYVRYEPWLASLGCLALVLETEWLAGKGTLPTRRWASVALVLTLLLSAGAWFWRHARNVEFKATELRMVRDSVRCRVWIAGRYPTDDINPEDFVPRYNYLTMTENHIRLLAKQLGWKRTEILGAGGWRSCKAASRGEKSGRLAWTLDERQWLQEEGNRDERDVSDLGSAWCEGNVWDGFFGGENAEDWEKTPWLYYCVRRGDRTDHVEAYHLEGIRKEGEGWMAWVWRKAKFAAHAWFVTYPRELGKWLTGRGVPRA